MAGLKEKLPWSYERKVRDFLRPGVRLLDMSAGAGEFLLGLGHPPALTAALVQDEAEFLLCQKRLGPPGAEVCWWREGPLPFGDGSFDLLLNDRAPLDPAEAARVLGPGGFLVAQQTGGQEAPWLGEDYNLENVAPRLEAAGFRLNYAHQFYGEEPPCHRFMLVGKRR
ncbi:class I SAM-dependent methyltransferase [Acutalibacter intestini]|uniref:class I SAM-dependent methyltransferase n=1 Tax=Acutalibacter intestini TaxID=3093659 RepID=UPI002AC94646|nr:hypothetical protein [Acutalibacter sp. M00204]